MTYNLSADSFSPKESWIPPYRTPGNAVNLHHRNYYNEYSQFKKQRI